MTRGEAAPAQADVVSGSVILLLALSCGIVVANLYYVQPLVGLISEAYGLPLERAGLLVTVTQLGYVAGLVLIVPLGDIVENRRLVVAMLAALAVALAGSFAAPSIGLFLAGSIVVGLMASAVQVLVPFAGHLANEANRGRVVGNVVSGMLLGIMLARPVASFCAHVFGRQSIFLFSAAATVAVAATLALRLPKRQPTGMPYFRALVSLGPMLAHTGVLHRRSCYQGALFGCFTLFWTDIPLLLAGPHFQFTQLGIGLFALVGAGGAVVSPFAGRAADGGHGTVLTVLALCGAIAAFLVAIAGGLLASWPLLVVAAVGLDMSAATHLVTGQREIFALGAEARGRLNGLYLALFFLGGALGSSLAGVAYARGGWTGACVVGALFPTFALGVFCADRLRGGRPGA